MPKNQLTLLRKEIDHTDRQIAALCKQRLGLTEKVFAHKNSSRLPLVSIKREQQVAMLFRKALSAKSTNKRIKSLVQALIQLNPKYPIN